jgi:hypothetical protein
MKSTSNIPTFLLGGFIIVFFSFFSSAGDVNAGSFSDIGCGNPGLKVIAKQRDPSAIVIYHELPETPFGGFAGVFMTNENIQVIVDHGFGFHKDMDSFTAGVPLELYPFGPNSAFTDEIGATEIMTPPVWLSGPPEVGYRLINNALTIFTNVQQEAQMQYHLHKDEIFLGFVEGKVFFCKNKPVKVFWREPGSQKEYYYDLPKAVIDIFGVTKAISPGKDIGFVVIRKKPYFSSIWLPPKEDVFIEISLSSGKLVRSDE